VSRERCRCNARVTPTQLCSRKLHPVFNLNEVSHVGATSSSRSQCVYVGGEQQYAKLQEDPEGLDLK
jgi:hypothetical protein